MIYLLQQLNDLVTDALNHASQMGFGSIAVPAIGTGNLHFPRDVVAEIMFNSVIEFSKANPTTSVKDVRFVLYDQDQSTIDVRAYSHQTKRGRKRRRSMNNTKRSKDK